MSVLTSIRLWLSGTADARVFETHNILIRCARRCAYDLGHALEMIDSESHVAHIHAETIEHLRRNQRHWEMLFASGNSMKDYRLRLHHEIEAKDEMIRNFRELCAKNSLIAWFDDDIPF